MDICWMSKHEMGAYFLAPVVLVSALALCYMERRITHMFINFAILNWIIMNIAWMALEYHPNLMHSSVPFWPMAMGFFSIGLAALLSRDLRDTFSHFRRFRAKNWVLASKSE